MMRRSFLTALAAAPAWPQKPESPAPVPPAPAGAPPAQSPAEDSNSVIKVDVDFVNIYCAVRDKRGAFIRNLQKTDFQVFEEGKQQEIRSFTRETDLPLTIGLLVDVSKSQENLIEIERRAAAQFFRKVLRPKDMAFLISFGAEVELLQDFTGSAGTLEKGLGELRLNAGMGGIAGATGTSNRGTLLYDSVYLAANEKLRSEVGRKMLVLITDGMDYGSRVKLREAVEAAHKSDAIIYSIYYVDHRYGFGGYGAVGSDSDLRKMSEETGGRVFHADRRYTLEEIFTEIQEEMRSQYLIGYAPSEPLRRGFRKLDVRSSNKDYRVHARKGYFAS